MCGLRPNLIKNLNEDQKSDTIQYSKNPNEEYRKLALENQPNATKYLEFHLMNQSQKNPRDVTEIDMFLNFVQIGSAH